MMWPRTKGAWPGVRPPPADDPGATATAIPTETEEDAMSFDGQVQDFDGDEEDDDGDDMDELEFEVNIDPDEDALNRYRIDQADFEQALYAALDEHGATLEATEGEDVSNTLEDLELTINGKPYRLGELASVSVEPAGDEDGDFD